MSSKNFFAPLLGTTDINLISGAESYPDVTQSETFIASNPDNPIQTVAYNDSRGVNANPINITGASVSTDGGNTFVRLTKANGQSPFDNTVRDPVVLYNRPTATWHIIWLDRACNPNDMGLGGYKSTTPWDPDSMAHYNIRLRVRNGLITIPVLPSTGACTFPGTTSFAVRIW